jgi:hypothetical protein
MAGHLGHLIDVLVLVLHGCAHGRVSHDVHDREQVFGRPIHFSSKAMTRAIEDEVIWQPGLLSGFLELFGDRCQMPPQARFEGKQQIESSRACISRSPTWVSNERCSTSFVLAGWGPSISSIPSSPVSPSSLVVLRAGRARWGLRDLSTWKGGLPAP